ncbi:MAG: hypothetical protein ABII16_03395 [Patescibacteria group bacterium]|nr:hypothetical protein [Patescibacteria group bacterium]
MIIILDRKISPKEFEQARLDVGLGERCWNTSSIYIIITKLCPRSVTD